LNKIRISCRINPHNFDMIRSVADVMFREGNDVGNFSEALDFILTLFRNETKYKAFMRGIKYKASYDRGVRTREVIDEVKKFEALFLRSYNLNQKQHN